MGRDWGTRAESGRNGRGRLTRTSLLFLAVERRTMSLSAGCLVTLLPSYTLPIARKKKREMKYTHHFHTHHFHTHRLNVHAWV